MSYSVDGKDGDDIIYYNLNIGNANIHNCGNPYDQTGIIVKSTANNNEVIIQDPSQYYCSIIRLSFPGYSIPAIQFLVQTPVTNINLGVYSFTMSYGASTSAQTFYIFVPNASNLLIKTPIVGTPTQDFQSGYYGLYDYNIMAQIMNTALAGAFASLQGIVGGAIAAANVPFFNYDAVTGLFSLYADAAFFDRSLATPINIYFNSPSYLMMDGIAFTALQYNEPTGKDNLLYIDQNHGINLVTVGGVSYVMMSQQYVSTAYMSSLKSILVTTNMNIRKETFNLDLGTDTGSSGSQNVGYTGVMTDFLPDISQPTSGISSYKFIYNAASLYRIFTFKDRTPLYTINASLSWTDDYGNIYPFYQEKGQVTSMKFMFIKKSAFKFSLGQ